MVTNIKKHRNRVLIFGAAGVGVRVKNKLELENNIVLGFIDNNPQKWGQQLEGVSVMAPKCIYSKDFDYIAIGIYKAADAIKQQLIEMGVEESRIVTPIKPNRISYNDSIYYKEDVDIEGGMVILQDPSGIQFLKNVEVYKVIDFENDKVACCCYMNELSLLNGNVLEEADNRKLLGNKIYVYRMNDEVFNDLRNNSELIGNHAIFSKKSKIKNMIDSDNTYLFWKNRPPKQISSSINNRFSELNEVLRQYNVPDDEVCVVGGTVRQLWKNELEKFEDDLDIIMTSRFRELYGKDLIIVSRYIEVHPQDEYAQDGVFNITDDEIVNVSDNYFYYRGIKCLARGIL